MTCYLINAEDVVRYHSSIADITLPAFRCGGGAAGTPATGVDALLVRIANSGSRRLAAVVAFAGFPLLCRHRCHVLLELVC